MRVLEAIEIIIVQRSCDNYNLAKLGHPVQVFYPPSISFASLKPGPSFEPAYAKLTRLPEGVFWTSIRTGK